MNKTTLIVVSVIVVAAIAFGAFWLGNRSKNENTNTVNNSNAPATTANQPTVNATYEAFSNTALASGYTFDTVSEWTSVAPEEVQKSITEEQRNGYELVYYSSNPDAVVLAVSEKRTSETVSSLSAVVEADLATTRSQQSDLTVLDQRAGTSDAQTELRLKTATIDYTIFSRYLALPPADDGQNRWALMEVSVPTTRTSQYSDIVMHLVDSLQLEPE